MSSYQDRYYQADFKKKFMEYYSNGGTAGIAVHPTGSGKSLCAAWAAVTATKNGRKSLIVIDSQELVAQNAAAVRRLAPGIDVGIYSAGLGCKMPRNDIVVCSIQSVWRKPDVLGPRRMIVVDECHASSAELDMYGRFLEGMRRLDPKMLLCGLTASPYRSEQGHITEPWMKGHKRIDPIFTDVFHEVGIKELIDAGYLSKMIAKRTDLALFNATARVSVNGDDYNQAALQAAANTSELNNSVVREALRLGHDRKSWLTFATGVDHARDLAEMFNSAGIRTKVLHAKTDKGDRARMIADHKSGELQNLANVRTLTKGFDSPGIDFIVDAAPTKSAVLHLQKLGRGFRISNGKEDCLVCDMSGNLRHFGAIDLLDNIEVKPKTGKKYPRQNKMQNCVECDTMFPKGAPLCPECGHKAPPPQLSILEKMLEKADESAVIISDGTLSGYVRSGEKLATVTGMAAATVNPGRGDKPASIRIVYQTSEGMISHFLCPAHGGYARGYAAKWWADHMPEGVPMSSLPELACKVVNDNMRFIKRPDYLVLKRDEADLFFGVSRFLFPGAYINPSLDKTG